MTFHDAYDLVWDRGKAVDPAPSTCRVHFSRHDDDELAQAFAQHLPALGGFELPAEQGRCFVVRLLPVDELEAVEELAPRELG